MDIGNKFITSRDEYDRLNKKEKKKAYFQILKYTKKFYSKHNNIKLIIDKREN